MIELYHCVQGKKYKYVNTKEDPNKINISIYDR